MKSFGLNASRVLLLALATIFLSGCYRPSAPRTLKEKKAQRKKLQQQKPQKQIKHMNLEEAISAAAFYEERGSQDHLIATYHQIMAKTDDPEVVAQYNVKLADLYFGDGNFAEAKKQYKRVITLYPGYSEIERARFREVMTHFWSSPPPSRDQTATSATIKLGRMYLKDFPTGAGSEQVQAMVASAYKKLLESELLIIRFYVGKYSHTLSARPLAAAAQRLENIKTYLIPKMQLFVPEASTLSDYITLEQTTTSDEATPQELEYSAQLISEQTAKVETFLREPRGDVIKAKDMRDRF